MDMSGVMEMHLGNAKLSQAWKMTMSSAWLSEYLARL